MRLILQDVIVQLRLFEEAAVHALKCANRTVYTFTLGHYEYTLTKRDLNEADGYDRVEVLGLLKIVRAAERVQQWRCPEPTEHEVQGAARKMLPPQGIP